MKRKEFQNLPSTETPITAENLNEMQSNIEESCVVVSPTEPTTNEKVWIQKGKNLIDKDNANICHYYLASGALAYWDGAYILYIPCQPNTTYTIQKTVGYPFEVWTTATIPATGVKNIDYAEGSNKNSLTITTSETAKYLNVYYYNTDCSLTEAELRSSIQIELGSTATEYEAYVEKAIHTKNDNGLYEEFYNENKIEKYSTVEQVIGTWIDAKPLYRKVVNYGTLPNSQSKAVSSGITNVENITSMYGATQNPTSNACLSIPFASGEQEYGIGIAYLKGTNQVQITTGTDRTDYTKTYIVVEYTKTTD